MNRLLDQLTTMLDTYHIIIIQIHAYNIRLISYNQLLTTNNNSFKSGIIYVIFHLYRQAELRGAK